MFFRCKNTKIFYLSSIFIVFNFIKLKHILQSILCSQAIVSNGFQYSNVNLINSNINLIINNNVTKCQTDLVLLLNCVTVSTRFCSFSLIWQAYHKFSKICIFEMLICLLCIFYADYIGNSRDCIFHSNVTALQYFH